MWFPILSLHHVTATVDEAQPDLDFYVHTLGLRLVKKTVNFDNHHVYHFYYGDERGTPGTIWTTFPYHGRGVRVGTKGAGQVTVTSFSVPPGALGFWTRRLTEGGYAVAAGATRFGEDSVMATDPSGLAIELVATAHDSRTPWHGGGIEETFAIRGLHSVTMTIRDAQKTVDFMHDVLGYSVLGDVSIDSGRRIRVGVSGGGPGKQIDLVVSADAPTAVNGLGTVHHVAMAIADDAAQLRLRDELVKLGCQVTPVMDRQYFRSIYFREPGGVLFEAATLQPGFTVDEPVEELGRALKLPPWEEPHRPQIEAGLAHVQHPH
jgi:glyoxalase family protein